MSLLSNICIAIPSPIISPALILPYWYVLMAIALLYIKFDLSIFYFIFSAFRVQRYITPMPLQDKEDVLI